MVLGIDLGTTYSVGAYTDNEGNPCVVANLDGENTTPSVVFFEDETSVIVGQAAKDNCIIDSQNVVSTVKNHMGEKKVYKSTYGKEYTPEVISSFILRKIVTDAEKRLGENIKDVVITIPAYFTDAQRIATEDAAKIAGLNLLGTINEPTAAALYYATSSNVNSGNIMIYDLGGGTFDVTIIQIDNGDIVVKSTGGLSKVGGRFLDEKIVDYISDYMDERYDIDIEDEEYIDTYQDLYEKVEKAKIQLSNKTSTKIVVRFGTIKDSIIYTRDQFEEIVEKLYKRSEFVVKKALSDAKLSFSDLDKVILVGGSSKIPYIENKLSELTGKTISHEVHPDLVVAQGAALFGKQLEKNEKTIYDVCSHSIGVVTLDPITYKKKNSIQIKRNTTLPTKVTLPFKTAVVNQRHIEFTLTEGEFEEITDVSVISTTDIDLPNNLPEGTKGIINLELDESQIIHVFLEIPSADFKEEFSFERKSNLTEDEKAAISGIIADYDIT